MKRTIAILVAVIFTIVAFHSFRMSEESTISGMVVPPDGAEFVWAVNSTDTVKTVPVNGAFTLSVKTGIYKVIVDSKDPFKDAIIENIEASDGQNTDLGEIRLQQ